MMSRTWLSIRVELVEGHGEHLWPRPGRIFAAARTHTFAQLASAIDNAFARWDRAHLHEFTLPDGTRLTTPHLDWEDGPPALDDRRIKLSRLTGGEQFLYVFDFGDDWTHLCTVDPTRIDPLDSLGIAPDGPLPYWGWGDLPDQYRRCWDADDHSSPLPPDPRLADLPPLRPDWGQPDPPPWRNPMTLGGH
jgi:pRiA4b ORF-3-like protein